MASAAVFSLKHTIQRFDDPINTRAVTHPAYWTLKSLHFLLVHEINNIRITGQNIDMDVYNEWDAKIRDAVWKLEDVFESYHHPLILSYQRLDVEKEVDSFVKTARKLRCACIYDIIGRDKPLPSRYRREYDGSGGNKSTTVGLSDLSEQISTQLLSGSRSRRDAVSIWGMAGIGKTHLARLIYNHPLIVKEFDLRIWVTLGPKNETEPADRILTHILPQILHQVKPRMPINVFNEESGHIYHNRCADLLRNLVRGRRYLIIFDDVWPSNNASRTIIRLLPNEKNGSRVLFTTRIRRVAELYPHSYEMPFLNNEESWNLFWQNVFVDESAFPSQLEKEGRKIAEQCEGLPLLILAVADILRGLDKTQEYWSKVAEKKTTTFVDAYENIYQVLLTSYEHLFQQFKPCFLYMGVFPQCREIPLSKLSHLWVLEDFFEPSMYQKWEMSAMTCVEELVSNSIVIICKRSFERASRIKSCKLHSVYWYLCVKEASKNKLFHVLIKLTDLSIERPRRLSVQNNVLLGIKGVYESMAAITSTTRTLLFTGEDHQYPVPVCFSMMLLLKVLDALAIRFYEFPEDVVKLLHLRYLALTHNGELPSSINKLKELEWLILRRHHNIKLMQRDSASWLPEEIWDMKKLRYLRVMGSDLPVPSQGTKIWELLTLHVNVDSCREDVFTSIPNLKKLGIKIELQPVSSAETLRFMEHIGILSRLKSLKCVVVNPVKLVVAPSNHLSNLPRGLVKLSLNGLGYSWEYMSVIGSLSNLKVLKLRCSAFQGPEWEAEAGQFKSLEFLLLEDLDLLHWKVKCWFYFNCFPSLRHLILRHCYKLKMIPREIGGARYLERMEVDDCSPSVVACAEQIKEKRSSLQVVVSSTWSL